MSWLYSQALVEEYSGDTSSDGEQFVQSSGNPTQQAYLSPDKMTEYSRLSRFGMMFKPLTADRGEALLMSYLAAFPAKPIPKRRLDAIQRTIFGQRCGESWQMSLPGTFLPKTSAELQSTKRLTTANRWVTKPKQFPLARKTWVLTTYGKDIGYLHTPTTIANYSSPSMQKWPNCRSFVTVFGKPNPANAEWLMGWPLGWTDLKPLEMDKFQKWQEQHGSN
jgi:hypothetical protein